MEMCKAFLFTVIFLVIFLVLMVRQNRKTWLLLPLKLVSR